jgi:hypothetical protein
LRQSGNLLQGRNPLPVEALKELLSPIAGLPFALDQLTEFVEVVA